MVWAMTVLLIFALAVTLSASEGAADVKFVCNFRSPADVEAFKTQGARAEWTPTTEDGAQIEGVALEEEAVKGGAMHLVLLPLGGYTTLAYTAEAGMPSDWSGYDFLVLNFDNGSEFMINMHLLAVDGAGKRHLADNLWICRSRNRLEVPLSEFRTAEGDPLDLGDIREMTLEIRSEEKFERDLWLYQFHLSRASEAALAGAEGTILLDFAPLGGRLLPGARGLTETTSYAAWRGYGWTTPTDALSSTSAKKLAALAGNWIYADLADAEAVLRVDLPDGKYRGRFYGGNYNQKIVPVRSFELAVNGVTVAAKAVDPATYYSESGHFFGLDYWYEPGEDPYDKYIKPFYQEYDFEFTVEGGSAEFAWRETLAGFGLLVAPADGFSESAEAVERARRASFAENITEPVREAPLPEPTEEEASRGFLLWSRPYLANVGIYDVPTESERGVGKLSAEAARGEREIVSFTVTPIAEAGEISVEVSDLVSQSGATIAASAVEVRVLRYMWNGWPASLESALLFPSNTAPGFAGANRRFYLTVTPPADAAGGRYAGKVTVAAAGGSKATLELELDVRPFELVRDHDVSFSWWRCSPYNMNYCLQYFLPEKIDYLRRMLDAEAASLAAHGCNAYYFTAPFVKGVDGEKVVLDFSLLDEEVAVCKKYGLCDEKRPGMIFTLPDIARYLMKETRYGDYMEPEDISALPEADRVEEFSDLFNARWIDAVRQIDEYFKAKGLAVLIYPADEPRERNTNRWNRNIEDTIRYCELLRKHLPDARIYVDPMRDGNSGVDYFHLVDHVDVLGTHPWDQSAHFIEHCRKTGAPDIWYFNAIMWDRYDFGFQVAAAGARGFWQWHLQWDLVPFQPFHPGFKWGVTVPGPDGPIDKVNYELVADSIDDYRYIATLKAKIEAANSAGKAADEAAAAQELLAEFYAAAPPYPTEDDYRSRPRRPRNEIAGRTLDGWRAALGEHIVAIDIVLARH